MQDSSQDPNAAGRDAASASGGSGNRPGGSGGTTGGSASGGASPGSGGGTIAIGGTGGSSASGGASTGGSTNRPATGGTVGGGGSGGVAGRGATGGVMGPGTGGNGSGGSGSGGMGMGTGTGGAASGGMGTGGAASGGMGTGGAASGGAGPTACSLPNHSGNGSFTFYFFGQGTAREGNGFRTACGYFGTESGQTDTVENIATPNTYFAAIPGVSPSNFNTVGSCGACVELTGQNGRRIIATVIDECPQNSNPVCNGNPNGHLDLSVSAFQQLGFSVGNPTGTTWRFVPCPVTGRVKVRIKTGNPNEVFIENSILAIRSVSLNGTMASRMPYGAWHFANNLAVGQMLQLTDAAGRVINVPIASTAANVNQDSGQQFPACM